jgi:hypothetical protein
VREYEFVSSCVGSLLARVCIGDLVAADLAERSTAWLVVKMVRPRCSQGRRGSRSSEERAARERAHVSTGRSLELLHGAASPWSIKANVCSRCEVPRRVATVKWPALRRRPGHSLPGRIV